MRLKGLSLCLVLALCFHLAGCGKPTIDTSTDDSSKSSIVEVKASLPEDQRDEFEEALTILFSKNINLEEILQGSQVDPDSLVRKMKDSVHGKTGLEVIAMADEIRKEREAERLVEEDEEKAKVAQLLILAEELRAEGDYERALSRYQRAAIYDHDNVDIQRQIVQVERMLKEEREQTDAREKKVRELISEARKLEDGKDLAKGLAMFHQALELDGKSEAAQDGIEKTVTAIKKFEEVKAYLPRVELYAFEASMIDTFLEKRIAATRFKLKNNGDRTLTEVEVTVYLKDAQEKVIFEKVFRPVFVTRISFTSDNKPLKPNYIWEIENENWFTMKSAPSEWQVGNAEARVTNIKLAEAESIAKPIVKVSAQASTAPTPQAQKRIILAAVEVAQERKPKKENTAPARPLTVDSGSEIPVVWLADQHLYVKGSLGPSDEELAELEIWLDANAENWTVVLLQNASGERFTDAGGASYSGMDAVEHALGKSLSSIPAFRELKHTETGQENGAVFVLYLQERKMAYFASETYSARSLGDNQWQGNLDRPAIQAMRNGGRLIDAAKNTISNIDKKLAAMLVTAKAESRARAGAIPQAEAAKERKGEPLENETATAPDKPSPEKTASSIAKYAAAPASFKVVSILGGTHRKTALINDGGRNHMVVTGDIVDMTEKGGRSHEVEIVDILTNSVIIKIKGQEVLMAIKMPTSEPTRR